MRPSSSCWPLKPATLNWSDNIYVRSVGTSVWPVRVAASPNTRKPSQQAERVTRTVKGQKEITIDIAALAGKGYPVPVNQNPPDQPEKKEGGGGKRNATSTGAQRKRTG